MSNITFVETVSVLRPDGQIRPVGNLFKKLKRAVTLPKKMNSLKDAKKLATLKNIVGVAASVIAPGVGSLVANAAITASDVAKAQAQNKKIKQAADLAAKKDKAAIIQITESFKTLKAESDKFRAARGLKPLDVTLPDITKSTPEAIEAVFVALQNDAAAILDAESRGETPSGGSSGTNKTVLFAGAAVAGLGLLYFILRKRK
jgi:hypothetical protein